MQLGFRDPSLDYIVKGSEVGSFIDHRLGFRLRRCLALLGGSDLRMELVVELPQCLLLMDIILAIESCLLSIAIRLGLLFFHCSHISKHLKEQVFVLLWLLILAAAPCGEEELISLVVCG